MLTAREKGPPQGPRPAKVDASFTLFHSKAPPGQFWDRFFRFFVPPESFHFCLFFLTRSPKPSKSDKNRHYGAQGPIFHWFSWLSGVNFPCFFDFFENHWKIKNMCIPYVKTPILKVSTLHKSRFFLYLLSIFSSFIKILSWIGVWADFFDFWTQKHDFGHPRRPKDVQKSPLRTTFSAKTSPKTVSFSPRIAPGADLARESRFSRLWTYFWWIWERIWELFVDDGFWKVYRSIFVSVLTDIASMFSKFGIICLYFDPFGNVSTYNCSYSPFQLANQASQPCVGPAECARRASVTNSQITKQPIIKWTNCPMTKPPDHQIHI